MILTITKTFSFGTANAIAFITTITSSFFKKFGSPHLLNSAM